MHNARHLILVGLLSTCVQSSKFQTCAKRVISQFWTDNSYAIVSSHLVMDNEWYQWMPTGPYIVISQGGKIFEMEKQPKPTTYIILVDHSKDYEHFLETLYLTSLWNPRAKFFILDLGGVKASELFEISLKYFALDVIIISHDEKIYTYYPYHDGYCGNPNNFQELAKCEDVRGGYKIIYQRKPAKAYNKCPIRVGVYYIPPYAITNNTIRPDDPGIEIMILSEIVRRANLELKFLEHNITTWANVQALKDYFSLYQEVLDGKADLLLGGVVVTPSLLNRYDATKCYLLDKVAFYVPAPEPISEAEIFRKVFEGRITIAMWISFHLVGVVFWLSSNLLGQPRGFKRLSSALWIIMCITYLSSTRYHRLTKQRLLMFLWVMTFFALSVFFGSRLTSMYTTVPLGQCASSVKDFKRYGLQYGGIVFVRFALENYNDEDVPPLEDWVDCDESLTCADRVARKRDFAVFKSSGWMKYSMSRYIDKNGRRMVKALDKPIIDNRIWTIARKGFPFLDRFNELLSMMAQSGLIAKWSYYSTIEPPVAIGDNFKTITSKALLIPIQMLVTGYIFGTIAFLVELLLKGRPIPNWDAKIFKTACLRRRKQ